MIGIVVVIVAIPALAHDVFLLDLTADRILTALAFGAAGAAIVEIAYRSGALVGRTEPT
jgi:hypothetical protein